MYTVIIYLEDELISIEKYKFIFYSLQEDNQLYLCPWREKATVGEIVNIVNEVTQNRQEWKLIIFAGMCSGPEQLLEGQMKEKVKELVRLYTSNDFKDEDASDTSQSHTDIDFGKRRKPKIMGFFPDQLYYVVCESRRTGQGRPDQLLKVDDAMKFGGRFRMFWFDVDMSCEKSKYYDWFRLNCILLILAVNQIPSGVLDYGYLYHLDIDIDSEKFSRYVSEQEACLKQIEERLEYRGDELQRVRKTGNGYIEDTEFDDSLEECRKSIYKNREIVRLHRTDLTHQARLYGKLDKNRREVHARLYFPKGLLREEAARVQDRVEKRPGADEFLSIAGENLLERKMWEKLEEICKKKRVPLKQTEYERTYEELEEDVRRCAQKKMKLWIKIVSCILLSVLETVIIVPFFHYSIHIANAAGENPTKNVLFRILECVGVDKVTWPWPGILQIGLFVWAVCAGCVFLLVFVGGSLKEVLILYAYHRHIHKKIINRQEQRINYYEEVVNLLAEYQYCIRLLQEQRERERDWEKSRAKLQYHRNAWRQNSVVCRQLKFFTESEEIFNSAITSFDIQDDPGQIEYYWTPFKESRWQVELNRSGLHIRGIFNFITRVHITKTVCREPYKS